MKAKIIKSILVPTSGILTVGVVSPILASSCGEQSIPVESIKINEAVDTDPIRLNVGGNVQLTATVLPENATNKKVTWKSSDKNIATVNEDGLVTGIRTGKAIITVITNDGGKEATCNCIMVVKATGVRINEASTAPIQIIRGATYQLTATIYPEDATNKNVTWNSSSGSIASVNNKTGLVAGNKVGTATITVTTEDGGHTAICKISVIEPK